MSIFHIQLIFIKSLYDYPKIKEEEKKNIHNFFLRQTFQNNVFKKWILMLCLFNSVRAYGDENLMNMCKTNFHKEKSRYKINTFKIFFCDLFLIFFLSYFKYLYIREKQFLFLSKYFIELSSQFKTTEFRVLNTVNWIFFVIFLQIKEKSIFMFIFRIIWY